MSPRESIIPVFVPHLGCPHFCVFCNQNSISGAREPVTPQTAADTLEAGLIRLGGETAEAAFYGGSFTALPAEGARAYVERRHLSEETVAGLVID